MKLVVARRATSDSSIFFGWWCLSDVICHLLRCVFHRQIFIAGLFHTKITTPHYFIVEHSCQKRLYCHSYLSLKITFEVRNYAGSQVVRNMPISRKYIFGVKTSFDAKNYARPKVIRNMPSPLILILLWYSDAVFFTLSEIFTQSVDSFQVCNHRESSENEI